MLVVTTLSSFLAFLDSTIVNVALQSLSRTMDTSLSTVQWLITAYLLALAAALPTAGWASDRFGAKRVYLWSVAGFTLGSLACGLATSIGQLIAFRAIQGGAAALATSVATMLAVRAAGPELIAKVMSVTGVPTVLAPIVGPAIGGLLLEHAGWRWIFLINVPIGAAIVAMSLRLLPPEADSGQGTRLDVPGLATLAMACVGLTYGLAELGEGGDLAATAVLLPVGAGLALLAAFVVHALRSPAPLLDLRLHRIPRFAAAAVTNFCLGAVTFGAFMLLPLYFQIARHENTVDTGLLLIPQGVGTAIAIAFSAKLTKALGTGRTALLGGLISVVGTVPFVLIAENTSYWLLGVAMVVRGMGIGAAIVPAMTAAYVVVPPTAIADATVQLSVLQRIAGSLSTAVFAVVLQNELAGAATPGAQADGFGTVFWWVLATGLCAAAPMLLLIAAERRDARAAAPGNEDTMPDAADRKAW
ncbi:MAG: DHA2 family efflux MFS transporter permease subunit [Streptomyces sp.]|uniref:DHA2 family efflux MFS transporter permease subunit n=1 Tax=Streptomyces sp. TaxID=1931 RepID=UPI003D6BAAF9